MDSNIVGSGFRNFARIIERNLPPVKEPRNTAFTKAPSILVVCRNESTANVVR